jgi:hypothetical protein
MKESTVTTSPSSQEPPSKNCQQCVQHLHEIFRRPDSRPLQMLLTMGAVTDPNTRQMKIDSFTNGMAVSIPKTVAKKDASSSVSHSQQPVVMDHPRAEGNNTIQATSLRKTEPATTAPSLFSSLLAHERLFIMCRPCRTHGPEGKARAFIGGPEPSVVVLCSNRLNVSNQREIEEVLVHELVHAYDSHVQKLDFSSCLDLAYSEVRASREAECYQTWLLQDHCIKTTAAQATDTMFPKQGRGCVQQVFAAAMADHKPFDVDSSTAKGVATTTTTTPSTTASRISNRHPRIKASNYNASNSSNQWNDSSNANHHSNTLPRSYSIQQPHSQR